MGQSMSAPETAAPAPALAQGGQMDMSAVFAQPSQQGAYTPPTAIAQTSVMPTASQGDGRTVIMPDGKPYKNVPNNVSDADAINKYREKLEKSGLNNNKKDRGLGGVLGALAKRGGGGGAGGPTAQTHLPGHQAAPSPFTPGVQGWSPPQMVNLGLGGISFGQGGRY